MNESHARYELMFAGKSHARGLAHTPAESSLVADLNRSRDFERARDVFVEGENLEVLKCLLPAYFGRIQMIYIDPPYNTGNDFVFRDDFRMERSEYLRESGQVDDMGKALVANPETAGRYHSTWLAMMYPRLCVAHQLLRDDGVLFVSIGDHEVHNLRLILDEIFGPDNFIAQVIVVSNRGGRDYLPIAITHESLLVYGRSPKAKIREVLKEGWKPDGDDGRGGYVLRELRNRNPRFHPLNRPNLAYPIHVAPQLRDSCGHLAVWPEPRPGYTVEVVPRNRKGGGSVWRWNRERLLQHVVADDPAGSDVVARQRRDGGYNIYEKHRKRTTKVRGIWDDPVLRSEQGTKDLAHVLGPGIFDHPKPVELVRRCIQLGTDPDGIILDFFAGSGTTCHAMWRQNRADGGRRRVILVQAPQPIPLESAAWKNGYRTVADIALARLSKCDEGGTLAPYRVFRTDMGGDGVWPMLTAEGFPLDSIWTAVAGLSKTWRIADPDRDLQGFVCFGPHLDRAFFQRLQCTPESVLFCLEEALDLSTAVNLGVRGRLRLVTAGETPI